MNITQDPIKGTVWAFTEKAVFRYKVIREERNVWQVRGVLEVRSVIQICEVRWHEMDCAKEVVINLLPPGDGGLNAKTIAPGTCF